LPNPDNARKPETQFTYAHSHAGDAALPHKFLVQKSLQRYWRWSRGLTLGAQGVVLTPDNRVLLVRHGYRPGWHFPGGGVEKNETVVTALTRELEEEAGVLLSKPPSLFGLYSHVPTYPGDHIALFVVRDWTQPRVPEPNREIAELGFFDRSHLPAATHGSTRVRLTEILDGVARSETW
jgi:8-oxo-dGTP pyrophosphatase MutT (NUDIX family)